MRRSLAIVLCLSALPVIVSADVITPLSYYTLPLLIPIILLETVLFWFLAKKFLGGMKFWKALLIVAISNVVSSLIGTLIPLYKNRFRNLMLIALAYVLSVFIEWGIYFLFLRRNPRTLLWISAVVNVASYVMLLALA